MFEAYFDESGDLEEESGIFCLSGYFVVTEAARRMQAKWVEALQRRQLAYFHMVDCAHGNGIFAPLSKPERIELVTELIAIIKKYTVEGFSIFASVDSYKTLSEAPDVYSDCAAGCVQAVKSFLRMQRVSGNVSYFFEAGHANRSEAYGHIARKLPREIDSVVFGSKVGTPLLGAADLLAWQSTKYAKDWRYPTMRGEKPKRPPRKDFQSLVEHPHMFAYMGTNGEESSMALEAWPLSRRSQHSVNLKVEENLAVRHLYEDGSPIPIIPVERTATWRAGGGQLTYLGFDGLMGDRFALAFDEPRLFEAISVFLGATGAYQNSSLAPMLSAEKIDVRYVNGVALLKVKISGGATIAIRLSDDALAEMKKHLTPSADDK
ncbi:DUF3800 domain-containing protein [Bradyrhizobium manausense]|uniref:DUF3800 domain-containing protein n=1 Tax=Bradyrhizobium TaxID=374 RepID=UPI001BA52B8C|nr:MULTISPECIES: DUF3800 domain-containing protein [Bradyrhizobium]MBR0824906.1 DUF3800 domain-containing protein [Bradyrhizobium manausense]UVO29324.1 DUF3800 domain-containing protein [Bradyrhizobium arachidis]